MYRVSNLAALLGLLALASSPVVACDDRFPSACSVSQPPVAAIVETPTPAPQRARRTVRRQKTRVTARATLPKGAPFPRQVRDARSKIGGASPKRIPFPPAAPNADQKMA